MRWKNAAEKLPYPCTETEFGRSWAGLIVVQGKVFPGGWDSEIGWWIAHPGCKVLSPNSVSHWMNYPPPPVAFKACDCTLRNGFGVDPTLCETCMSIRGVA